MLKKLLLAASLALTACAQLPVHHQETKAVSVTWVDAVPVDPLSFKRAKIVLAMPSPLPRQSAASSDQIHRLSVTLKNAMGQLKRRFGTHMSEDCSWNRRRDVTYLMQHYKTMTSCMTLTSRHFYTHMRAVIDAYADSVATHYQSLITPRSYRLLMATMNISAAGSYQQERLLGNYIGSYQLLGHALNQAPYRPDASMPLGIRSTNPQVQAEISDMVQQLEGNRVAIQASIVKTLASLRCLYSYCRPVNQAQRPPTADN